MSGDRDGSAAAEYKRVMAELTETATRLRADDQVRAEALERRLPGLGKEMEARELAARLTASVVQLHWEGALDLLWAEHWMKLRPRPQPDPDADPASLDGFNAEVRRCAAELRDAVQRRWFQRPRRSAED